MAIFGLQVEYKDNRAATDLIPKECMKIKHFYILQHGICFVVILQPIFKHPDRIKNSQENYFCPSQNSNRDLQHEANNDTAAFIVHSKWYISPKEYEFKSSDEIQLLCNVTTFFIV